MKDNFATKDVNSLTMEDQYKYYEHDKKMRVVRKNVFVYSIIIVQIINFIIFYIGVNTNSILMSFQLKKRGEVYWTLENFVRVYNQFFGEGANSSELMKALTNTLKFFLLGQLLTPVALCTSYFMFKKIYGYRGLQIIFFLPGLVSGVVWSLLYKEIVGPNGPIVDLMQWANNTNEVYLLLGDTRYALKTVMGYTIWFGIASNFVLYGGALSRIPVEVLEAGKLDGISWIREFIQVIIPLIWPTVGTLLILSLVGIFTASGNILLLTNGAWGTNTVSFYIFQNVYGNQLTSNSYNLAACVGLCFTLLTLPVVFIARWLVNKVDDVQY